MDTSEIFIKMCSCSEIDEQWKESVGDYYVYKGQINLACHEDFEFVKEFKKMCIWLPRQDQIQEMMKNTHTLDGMLDCFNSFWNPNCELHKPYPGVPKGHGVFRFFHSAEQLWLAFYMHEKHGKVWGGSKWVKK